MAEIEVISISLERSNGRNRKYALCRCFCGTEFKTRHDRVNYSKGCGCTYRYESGKKLTNYVKAHANGEHGQRISAYKRLYQTYKNTCARRRGLDFYIKFDQFSELINKPCHYCGKQPSQIVKYYRTGYEALYNGIDRKDSSLGYTVDNTVTCCKRCNYAKQDTPYEDFIAWVKTVYANIIQNNM